MSRDFLPVTDGPPSGCDERSRGCDHCPVTDLRDAPTSTRGARGDLIAIGVAVALVGISSLVGFQLARDGRHLYLGFPPLAAGWMPHVGPGTPVAIAVALSVVRYGPAVAERMTWRPLLWSSWAVSVLWTFGLAMIDGWQAGVAGRLTTDQEYLFNVPQVGDIAAMMRTFSDHILTDQQVFWTTHVGAHPPGAFLLFVWLDRVGLGGGGAASTAVILIGASACAAVAVALRAFDGEQTARSVLPFSVLFPGAVWVGVSADGMFAAALAWSVALIALGATRRGHRADLCSLAGGLLLGYTLYLSYGLALAVPIALLPVAVTRRWRAGGVALAGAALVAAAFTAAGFWWPTGYHDLRIIYAESAAKDRPYLYFLLADLAAFACVIGPATIAGLRRLATTPRAIPTPAALLVAASAAAELAADVSGLSKAEVERIWLPFGVWLVVACALLPGRHRRRWLAAQALLAIGINSFLFTTW